MDVAGPPTQEQVDAVLQRLTQIPVKIQQMDQDRLAFMDKLTTRLHAIQKRVTAIAHAIGPMANAQRDLLTLRQRLVHPQDPNTIPGEAAIETLDTIIAALNPAALGAALKGLQDEVLLLERAVGLTSDNPPGPLGPPAGDEFHGGYKNTPRSRAARAKRLKTRKRLHSLRHSRRHRRKHKKRTYRRRPRRRRKRRR